ncbi:hypothetical protein HDU76_000832 [Blyttiomyces sp. JEL0837]|nr:hypothetical protein HDU76_000832 [Blyttiomyces sp. JEL0837]
MWNSTGIDISYLRANKFGVIFDTNLTAVFFKINLKTLLLGFRVPNAGQIHATPLSYTPPGRSQILFVLIKSCNNINPSVGILGTPVIDPSTDTAYFASKIYYNQKSKYEVHAVDIFTLQERPGFPVKLDGIVSDNRLWTFNSFWHLQRSGLLLLDGIVFVAFASHCDLGPFTGWIIGIDAITGAVVTKFITNFSNSPSSTGAGIWMSGSGLAADNRHRIHFATGNSFTGMGPTKPTNDTVPLYPLGGNTVAALQLSKSYINPKTKTPKVELKPSSFFVPIDRQDLDDSDLDLGSGGVILTNAFQGNGVSKVSIVIGKEGVMYVLNQDHLGGYEEGPNRDDKTVFKQYLGNNIWGRPAICPLDGGWIYAAPVNMGFQAFKFTPVNGYVNFTKVASAQNQSSLFGSGAPAVTSTGSTPGSCVVWFINTDWWKTSVLYA